MSIELLCICSNDECQGRIEDGDHVFCIDCWGELRKDIEGYKEDIAVFQDELRKKEEKLTDKDMKLREKDERITLLELEIKLIKDGTIHSC